jgi:hypothetical protein
MWSNSCDSDITQPDTYVYAVIVDLGKLPSMMPFVKAKVIF